MGVKTKDWTMEEIQIAGLEALFQNLGVVGAIRFLQYRDKGRGDYTKERHTWLGDPGLDEIASEVEKMRKQNG